MRLPEEIRQKISRAYDWKKVKVVAARAEADDIPIYRFESLNAAARALHVNVGNIRAVLNRRIAQTGGWSFEVDRGQYDGSGYNILEFGGRVSDEVQNQTQ